MIDRFAIAATGNLLFGDGTFSELDNQVALRGFAHAALLSSRTFSSTERFSHAVEALRDRGIGVSVIPVSGEPTVASIDRISKAVADAGCDVVVGIGGGSALDSAKAVAVMALQLARRRDSVSVKRYLEGVGDLNPPAERLGLIAIPTTAGTGSEATKNAVVADIGPQGFKKSLRHDSYIPDLVIIDPLLAKGLPRAVTAASGLDALTQLMEAYTSTKANPFIDALALDAIGRIGNALPRLLESEASDPSLRSDMAYAAYISGMAIANSGLGYVHGLAGPLGGLHAAAHGVICGSLIAPINRAMVEIHALSGEPAVFKTKMEQIALLWGKRGMEGVLSHVEYITRIADFPRLGTFGFLEDELRSIGSKDVGRNSPVALPAEQVVSILLSLL